MDEYERESVAQLLTLAKLAIVAMLITAGYLNQNALLGLV